jgi:4-aminobutyrate aminotransferase
MDWPPGSHATTFGGNPIACAAATATLDVLQAGVLANAAESGQYLIERLQDLQRKHSCIGDVRGIGLMIGMEMIDDSSENGASDALAGSSLGRGLFPGRNAERRNRVVQAAFQKGLILLGCGRNTVRFSPPLIVSRSEIDIAVEILSECLKETT